MATLLHRLGLFSARRPIAVLLAWGFVMAAAVTGMATLARRLSNEFEIPGASSAPWAERAQDRGQESRRV